MRPILYAYILSVCCHAATAQQPQAVTERYFSDAGFEVFETPSFTMEEGFASYGQVCEFLMGLRSQYANFDMDTIGRSTEGVPVIAAHFPPAGVEEDAVKILFTARVHGNEPAGTESLMAIASDLAAGRCGSYNTGNIAVAIIPFVNVEGGDADKRANGQGIDVNRDFTRLETPEARMLHRFVTDYNPDIIVDLHEYRPTRSDYAQMGEGGLTSYADAMLLWCEHPDYPQTLSLVMAEGLLPAIRDGLDTLGISCLKYFSPAKDSGGNLVLNMGAGSPRSTTTAFGLRGKLTVLAEIRGIGLGRTSFARRVYTGYSIARSTMEYATRNVESIRNAMEYTSPGNITVLSDRSSVRMVIPFIDLGTAATVMLDLKVYDSSSSTPVLTRETPAAYAILPSYGKLAEIVRATGVEMQVSEAGFSAAAEEFTLLEFKNETTGDAAPPDITVITTVESKKADFPPGTVIVRCAGSPAAAFIAALLEPEAGNGLLRYGIYRAAKGETLPVYRLSEHP